MRISLGNSIIERVRSYIVEEGGSSNDDCYIKQLGRRKYRVCNLGDKRLQKELLREIYYVLEKYLPVHFIGRLKEKKKFKNVIGSVSYKIKSKGVLFAVIRWKLGRIIYKILVR